ALAAEPNLDRLHAEPSKGEVPMSSSDRPRVPEKRTSLAEMARASQRAVARSVPPPPVSSSSNAASPPLRSSIRPVAADTPNPTGGDWGLIDMQRLRASAAPPPPSQVGSSHGFAGIPAGQSGLIAQSQPAYAPRIPVAPPLPEIEPARYKRSSSGAFWGVTIAV